MLIPKDANFSKKHRDLPHLKPLISTDALLGTPTRLSIIPIHTCPTPNAASQMPPHQNWVDRDDRPQICDEMLFCAAQPKIVLAFFIAISRC